MSASAAMLTPSVALPPIEHSTIKSSDVPMSSLLPQATPSVAGSTRGLAYSPVWCMSAPQHHQVPIQDQAQAQVYIEAQAQPT